MNRGGVRADSGPREWAGQAAAISLLRVGGRPPKHAGQPVRLLQGPANTTRMTLLNQTQRGELKVGPST
jgi:hypothetical protein